MSCKGVLSALCLVSAIVLASGSSVLAQEEGTEQPAEPTTPPEPTPPPEPATEPEAEEDADTTPWWGGRIGLFIEAIGGTAGVDDVNSSLVTNLQHTALSTVSFDDQLYGRLGVGWELAEGKGSVLLMFNGYKEEGYSLRSVGLRSAIANDTIATDTPLPWWTLEMGDGRLEATRNAPVWTDFQDADRDGNPDPDEVIYPGIDLRSVTGAPENLLNRAQTYELLYQRRFGNPSPLARLGGRWMAGLRHFVYEGNLPAAAWLSTETSLFTEGTLLRPILFAQDTSATGPTGHLEIETYFFNRRIMPYVGGRAAFVLTTASSDSGTIYTLSRNPAEGVGGLLPSEARLEEKLHKNSWQVGAELGVRFRIVEGLLAHIGYHIDSYQDVILLPDRINIPSSFQEAPFGSSAIYATQDLLLDGWLAGFSFQY